MFILATKESDGEIGDVQFYKNMHNLRADMSEMIRETSRYVGITAAKKQLVIFQEWTPTREFEAALDFELLSNEHEIAS